MATSRPRRIACENATDGIGFELRLRKDRVKGDRSGRHSVLSALIGEIDAARRAGMMAATNAQTAERPGGDRQRERVPERHAVELRGDQPAGTDRQRDAQRRAPRSTRVNAPRSTRSTTLVRSAPSAMRMPISLVRCATVYAVTP